MAWTVFPTPISSAIRQRPLLLSANLTPSLWKGSNRRLRASGIRAKAALTSDLGATPSPSLARRRAVRVGAGIRCLARTLRLHPATASTTASYSEIAK